MRFSEFMEQHDGDIFGFEKRQRGQDAAPPDEQDSKPLHQFDVEQMMEYLVHPVGGWHPASKYPCEMQWGHDFGAIKLEVDTGYRFLIKRLARDLQGNSRWITTKLYQLNRRGFGGFEESVASQIFDDIQLEASGPIPGPVHDFDDLDRLTRYISTKLQRVAEAKFLYEGIKKAAPDNYLIVFGVGGQGVEARDHGKIEENITDISYDRDKGTIRITNYNVRSKVGRSVDWKLSPVDMDLYFFPTQDRDQIAEAVATRFRYY